MAKKKIDNNFEFYIGFFCVEFIHGYLIGPIVLSLEIKIANFNLFRTELHIFKQFSFRKL